MKTYFTVSYVRQKNFTHFALVHQCFACTSWVVVPYHEAGEWSSVSDWVGNYQDKALWQEQKKGLDFDESNLFQIWPQHRADCTVEGCHKDRCRVFCGRNMIWEKLQPSQRWLGDNRPYESFFTWSLGFHWVCWYPPQPSPQFFWTCVLWYFLQCPPESAGERCHGLLRTALLRHHILWRQLYQVKMSD